MKKTMFAVFLTALVFCSVPAYAQDVWDVNLDDLLKEMDSNDARATEYYKNHRIRTWGIVSSIGHTNNNDLYVIVNGTKWSPVNLMVYFNASERSKVLNLNKGQIITFVGYSVDNYGFKIQNAVIETNTTTSYYWSGRVAFIEYNYDKAISDFTQAIRLNNFGPFLLLAYDFRGLVYEEKRDYNRAIADYEAALRIDPDFAPAKKKLTEARRKAGNR